MSNVSHGEAIFFVTFIDDYSRKAFIFLLKQKSEVFNKFKEFKALIENETNTKIFTILTDNGGDYCSTIFKNYCREHGIRKETTAPYTPQQNGIAERYNRTLMEMSRAMIFEKYLG